MKMLGRYEIIIGLEVHAQLATESKIFCSCSTEFGAVPNTHTCPVCLGMPGTLPVLNKKAIEYIIKAGLALNCEIAPYSRFDRKNYFYPDLPKGYQITQYDYPFCKNGHVDVEDEELGDFRVRIERIHLEEDAGKLIHGTGDNITQSDAALIDFNRAGVPLIEIVTKPDLKSPAQARAYLTTLKSILKYLGVSACNMEQGSLRADANVSLRPVDSKTFGTKTELKNMNSFRAIERALEYELQRQAEVLKKGGQITQETRTWDEKKNRTVSMRSKEKAHDYRYFPEPDLVPMQMDPEWLDEIRQSIGELPRERRERLIREYGLPKYDARILTQERFLANFFEATAQHYHDGKAISNWIMGDFLRLMKEEHLEYDQVKITGKQLAEMLKLLEKGIISSKIAKTVFEEMFQTGTDPEKIVEEKGLVQISDQDQLIGIVEQVLKANPQTIADYRDGKDQALKYLVGQVMKETRGKANPQIVNQLIFKKLTFEEFNK